MDQAGRNRVIVAGLSLVTSLAAGLLLGSPAASAASAASSGVDTVAPSTPTNIRQVGTFGGWPILGWDPVTDNSGQIDHYSVLVNGVQVYRPQVTTVRIYDLVTFCHVLPGRSYSIAIRASDKAGNRSGTSVPLLVPIL
jgi:hypothetical protein